jgi:hypothetical protein
MAISRLDGKVPEIGDFPIRNLLFGQMLRELVGGELEELPPVIGGQLEAEQGVG